MTLSRDAISVLHVDDDPQARTLVREYFEYYPAEFSVDSARDGARALDRLDDAVDCIVADYDMPGLDGLELLAAVRADYPDLPFVLLTGRGSEDVASDAISAGATDYFRKTGTLDGFGVLVRRIENVVARRRAEVSHRELFEKAAEGFALHDPETGAFVDANESVQRILGYDRPDLLTMTVDDITTVPENGGRSLLERLRRAAEDDVVVQETYCRRRDGSPFWMKLQFKSVTVNGRPLVLSQMRDVTERKRYEQTLSALHASMADLVGAEHPHQVTASVQTVVEDLLDAEHAAVFLHDTTTNRLTAASGIAAQETARSDDASIPLSADSPVAEAFIDGTLVETTNATVFDSADAPARSGRSLLLPLGDNGVLAIGTDANAFGDNVREFVEVLAGAATVALDRIRTDREIDTNRAELRDRTDEMERLTRTNRTLHELSSMLLQADTTEDAYEAVCSTLGALPPVSLAWIGVPDGAGALDIPVWSGSIPQYLDIADFDRRASEPAAIAARTGTTVRVDNTALDRHREPWRRTALTHGVKSVLAVPIEADGVTYGVLSVLGGDHSAFDDRFHEMVSSVATWTADAVSSIEQRQRALTPTTATVTYELPAETHFLGRLAAETGGSLDVVGVVTDAADHSHVFLDVTAVDPDRVCTLASRLAAVRTAEVVSTGDDGGALELHLETPILGVDVTEYTAEVSAVRATATTVQATTTVASADDVRDVADAIRDHHPDATLLSKRQRTDPLDDHERLRSFRDALTPRQREVVEVAYLNGYFDSPRRCKGADLGDQLGISSQAVHQHLRTAQRALFEEVFDGSLGLSTRPKNIPY